MTWVVSENPEFKGMKPRILTPVCHDQSPFITVRCSFCKAMNHMHETQIAEAPEDAELWMNCASCGLPGKGMVSEIRFGFSELRREGWIE